MARPRGAAPVTDLEYERSQRRWRELNEAIAALRAEREGAIAELGSRPTWLRPFARRRWNRRRADLGKGFVQRARELAVLSGNTDRRFLEALEYVWS